MSRLSNLNITSEYHLLNACSSHTMTSTRFSTISKTSRLNCLRKLFWTIFTLDKSWKKTSSRKRKKKFDSQISHYETSFSTFAKIEIERQNTWIQRKFENIIMSAITSFWKTKKCFTIVTTRIHVLNRKTSQTAIT